MANPKKVTIVSSEIHHYSYIESIICCLRDVNCEINLLSDPNMYTMIDREVFEGHNHNFSPVHDKKSYKECINLIKSSDLVIFDEPESLTLLIRFFLLTIKTNNKYILTIHELNSWFFPRIGLRIKPFIKTLIRRLIVRRTKNYSVVGSNIFSFINTKVDKEIIYIPFHIPKISILEKKRKLQNRELKVVIPGQISRKRNYNDLFEYVLKDKKIKEKVEFVLLGYPIDSFGHNVVEKAKNLKNSGYKIVVFDNFIPKNEFDGHLISCDVILSIFDIEYENDDGQIEIYGQTKETGVSFLSLVFAKPVILPENYFPLNEIKSQVIPFKSCSDLNITILNLVNNRMSLQEITNEAENNLRNFDISFTRKVLANMLC